MKDLSTRQTVRRLKNAGKLTHREIGEATNTSAAFVSRLPSAEPTTKPKIGRPALFNSRQLQSITNLVKKGDVASVQDLKKRSKSAQVSRADDAVVRRALKGTGAVHTTVKEGLPLTSDDIQKRKDWIAQYSQHNFSTPPAIHIDDHYERIVSPLLSRVSSLNCLCVCPRHSPT